MCKAMMVGLVLGILGSGPSRAFPNSFASEPAKGKEQSVKSSPVPNLDQIPKHEFGWGWIRWMMNSQIDSDAAQTFGVVELKPGERNPLHSHPNCEEILFVISGSCKKTVGDETYLLKAGDLVRIPRGVPHRAITVGRDPMRAVIVYSSPNRQMQIHQE